MPPVPIGAVPVGPEIEEVLLSMGKGGEGVGSLKVTPGPVPVPDDVIAVGPSVGPEVAVLLPIGNGGEGEVTAVDDPPVGTMTVNVESVKEEERDSVPMGAVPVGPTVGPEVAVLLSIGKGAEGDETTKDDPVTTGAVTIGAFPVGPSIGPEVMVLLFIGNGGESDDNREDDPVPSGAVTLGAVNVGGGPGSVIFGRELDDEELDNSVDMLVDDPASPEDDASGTDAVSVGVQPTVV
ncbi:hypothetical protein E6O75_ATG08465 [Venturia nashicola]|uniref:Uncharacterized protein n=1 Tax=Venturia nashicola TaxID=86259 RepID=A0A4Z1NVA4_9PEZI|nr:hypothetical protein E6O75_ATG08465 [Venturia nashicola]